MKKIVAAACAAAVLAASTYAVRATAGPATSTPEIATATATSKSTEFDHLARSKDPRDAMRAYMTAMLCVWPTKEMKQAELTSPGERTASQKAGLASGALKAAADRACGDLTEAQINSRRQLPEG